MAEQVIAIELYRKQDLACQIKSLETQLAEKDEKIEKLKKRIDILTGKFSIDKLDTLSKIINDTKVKKIFFKNFFKKIWKMKGTILKFSTSNKILLWKNRNITVSLLDDSIEIFVTSGKKTFYFVPFVDLFSIFFFSPDRFWWRDAHELFANWCVDPEEFEEQVTDNLNKILKNNSD